MATLSNHSGSSPAAFPATHKSVVAIPISQETKFLAPGHWQLAEVWQARPLQGIRNACRAPSVPTFAPGDTLPFCKCSATGTRTRVARVRAEYPNQLDYGGAVRLCFCSCKKWLKTCPARVSQLLRAATAAGQEALQQCRGTWCEPRRLLQCRRCSLQRLRQKARLEFPVPATRRQAWDLW